MTELKCNEAKMALVNRKVLNIIYMHKIYILDY